MATICVGSVCITAPDELIDAAKAAIVSALGPQLHAWHAQEHAAEEAAIRVVTDAALGNPEARRVVDVIARDARGQESLARAAEVVRRSLTDAGLSDVTAGALDYVGAPALNRGRRVIETYEGPLKEYVALVLRHGAVGERDGAFRR